MQDNREDSDCEIQETKFSVIDLNDSMDETVVGATLPLKPETAPHAFVTDTLKRSNRIKISSTRQSDCYGPSKRLQRKIARRQGNVTAAQKDVIIEFMDNHENLKKGKFSASFTIKDSQILWQDLAAQLNAVPGPQKQWKDWRKTWADLRNKIRCKAACIRRHQNATGGGEPSRINLTAQEARIKKILDEVTIVGNDDIPKKNVTTNVVSTNIPEGIDLGKTFKEDISSSEQEIFDIIVRDANSDELVDAIESSTTSSLSKATRNKIQRRPRIAIKRLQNSMETTTDIYKKSNMKMEMKKEYYNAKLKLLGRIASAKERMAVAKERIASAKERSASASERLVEIAERK